jgi:hypothetical protein
VDRTLPAGVSFLSPGACGLHDNSDLQTIFGVPIKDEEPRSRLIREGLAQLLDDPTGGRMGRNVEIHDTPPIVADDELGTTCPRSVIDVLCTEAQENPFLMQNFCWEICFDLGIERKKIIGSHAIPEKYNTTKMFRRLSQDAGLPIYQKLAAGPQSRKVRPKRPLRGGVADIYQAVLLALAESGPKAIISYDDLRELLHPFGASATKT